MEYTREQLIEQKRLQLKIIDLALGILVGMLYGYAIDNILVGVFIGFGVGLFKWVNKIPFGCVYSYTCLLVHNNFYKIIFEINMSEKQKPEIGSITWCDLTGTKCK